MVYDSGKIEDTLDKLEVETAENEVKSDENNNGNGNGQLMSVVKAVGATLIAASIVGTVSLFPRMSVVENKHEQSAETLREIKSDIKEIKSMMRYNSPSYNGIPGSK